MSLLPMMILSGFWSLLLLQYSCNIVACKSVSLMTGLLYTQCTVYYYNVPSPSAVQKYVGNHKQILYVCVYLKSVV